MLPIDLHTHTIASGHAFSTLRELATAAHADGMSVLGITDHGPAMEGAPTPGYFEMVERIPRQCVGVQILMGCEANIINYEGEIDLAPAVAARQQVLLVGLHPYTPYPASASCRDNTAAIVKAIERYPVHIVSHPYRDSRPTDIAAVVAAACDKRVLLEVNLSLFRAKLCSSPNPWTDETITQTRALIGLLRKRGFGFVLNSDAHEASELVLPQALFENLQRLLEFSRDEVLNFTPAALARFVPALSI